MKKKHIYGSQKYLISDKRTRFQKQEQKNMVDAFNFIYHINGANLALASSLEVVSFVVEILVRSLHLVWPLI